MQIRVWSSFSANNSSESFTVAKFNSSAKARKIAAELTEILAEHAKQVDAREFYTLPLGPADPDPSAIQLATAKKYKFKWNEPLTWGDDVLTGDEPHVVANGVEVLVYHAYGWPAVHPYLIARGGELIDRPMPTVTVSFTLAPGKKGRDALARIKACFRVPRPKSSPRWVRSIDSHEAVFWTDEVRGGFHAKFDLGGLATLKDHFEGPGFTDYRIWLCDPSQAELCTMLARIRKDCASCGAHALRVDLGKRTKRVAFCTECGQKYMPKDLERRVCFHSLGEESIWGCTSVDEVHFAASGSGEFWKRDMRAHGSGVWERIAKRRVPLRGTLALTPNRILIGTERGEVLVTKNGGKRWSTKKLGTSAYVHRFARSPGGVLFAAGNSGILARSSDQGETWTTLKVPTTENFLDVTAPSERVAYACTESGKVFRTESGGRKWKKLATQGQRPLCRIHAFDELTLVAVGDRKTILTSANGGVKWTKRRCPAQGNLEGLCVGNNGRLFAVTSEGQLLMSDKGTRWSAEDIAPRQHLWDISPSASGDLLCVGQDGVVLVPGFDDPEKDPPM